MPGVPRANDIYPPLAAHDPAAITQRLHRRPDLHPTCQRWYTRSRVSMSASMLQWWQLCEPCAGENGAGGRQQGAQHRDGPSGRSGRRGYPGLFPNLMPHDVHGRPIVAGTAAGALFVFMLFGFVVESELTQVCAPMRAHSGRRELLRAHSSGS